MRRIILSLLLIVSSAMAVEVGKRAPKVSLSGDNGGKLSGSAWSSSSLRRKVHVVFYVDPDKKDLNNAFSEALKKKHFSRRKYGSVAIINLAATWMPNSLIISSLKKKQKKYPDTVYVNDKKKVLVKKWRLADDNSDVLVFNKSGRLIYKKFGKLSAGEIKKVISLIQKNL